MKAWEAAILGGAVDDFLRRYDEFYRNSLWRCPVVEDLKNSWMESVADARKRLVEMLGEQNVPARVSRSFQDVCSLRLTRDIRA